MPSTKNIFISITVLVIVAECRKHGGVAGALAPAACYNLQALLIDTLSSYPSASSDSDTKFFRLRLPTHRKFFYSGDNEPVNVLIHFDRLVFLLLIANKQKRRVLLSPAHPVAGVKGSAF